MLLKNKIIIVAGGSSGIGMASCDHFLKQGAKVLSIGLSDVSTHSVDHENWIMQTGDLGLEKTMNDAIETCIKKWGSIDGLFHVAGGSGRSFGDSPLHEITTEGWQKTLSINLELVMKTNRAMLNFFINQKKKGSIVNLSSVLSHHPSPHFFSTHAYAAAKAGITGLSLSAAAYYAPYDIRINVISPGLTDTPMAKRAMENESIQQFLKTKQPLDQGRAGKPDEVAALAAFLLSDQSNFITGQNICVDGGWSISEGQYHE